MRIGSRGSWGIEKSSTAKTLSVLSLNFDICLDCEVLGDHFTVGDFGTEIRRDGVCVEMPISDPVNQEYIRLFCETFRMRYFERLDGGERGRGSFAGFIEGLVLEVYGVLSVRLSVLFNDYALLWRGFGLSYDLVFDYVGSRRLGAGGFLLGEYVLSIEAGRAYFIDRGRK